MDAAEPVASFDPRYSDADANAVDWATARQALSVAELSWITTVRPDGRPHVTPLLTVCEDSTVYFCTGPGERKFVNLSSNPHVALTTGTNARHGGLDLVVEGDAVRVTDERELQRLADAWVAKYGEEWRFGVADQAFRQPGGEAWVFAVAARTVFGFGKDPYSQTRWRFSAE